jgi:carboxylesterase
LALLLADEFKGEISGVSCLSPTLFYDGWNSPWYRHLLPLAANTPLKYFFYFKEEPPYGIKNEAVRSRIHEFYSKADLHSMESVQQYGYPFFPVSLLCQLQKLVKHLNGRLEGISTPVQLIQAKHDDMSSERNSQFIYNRVRSQRKELVLLHNSYHIITADQERNTVAQHMQRFFSGQPQLV